ncbi:MAG: hypothetical protein K2X66_08310 [Cyanobacteria bacterium]|nr:hypothetical protein [Cyanobacteriota bacterium]
MDSVHGASKGQKGGYGTNPNDYMALLPDYLRTRSDYQIDTSPPEDRFSLREMIEHPEFIDQGHHGSDSHGGHHETNPRRNGFLKLLLSGGVIAGIQLLANPLIRGLQATRPMLAGGLGLAALGAQALAVVAGIFGAEKLFKKSGH